VQIRAPLIALILTPIALTGCSRDGEIDSTGGISVTRSACPAIAIPAQTGDITVFDPPASREAQAIDVVATITNLRPVCDERGTDVVTNVTFDVIAQRRSSGGARDVILPYFTTIVRGGRIVVSKSISSVALKFADGQYRASTRGAGTATINRAAATLPPAVRERLTRKRKAGDEDAAIDPLTDPAVKEAVQRASFEVLVGFQLTPEQLQYNATR
jgi:hypothetical protein